MQPGELFENRYRIQCEVGRGSFGIVYAAEDVKLGQLVAVKVLLPWTREVDSLRHRLKREAKLTRMLSSPHAVRVHTLDESAAGDLYIVMELLSGEELHQLLARERQISVERATEMARQVLDALAEAHRLGVIHRDLKPQNIFLCHTDRRGDSVKVLDFGIAKVAGTEDGSGLMETTKLTSPGGVLGTPSYMSPEQCRGEPLTMASDFYSLGIVLYELVTGKPPFTDPNAVQVLVMHNSQAPPPLTPSIARTPLGRAIMRALEKDPAARFRSALDFSAALDLRPVEAPRAAESHSGTREMAALTPAQLAALPPAPAAPARGSRRGVPWLSYAIAGGIAILVAVIVWSVLHS